MELQKIVHSVDVRIHHRIWDAQEHLPKTFDEAIQGFIESIVISLTIQ